MVDRWRQAADDAGLEDAAAELGKTPAELMIIASLVEAEGRGDDMPKIARVIFNRLDGPGDKGGTNGRLQIDASVNYGLDQELGVGADHRAARSRTRPTTPTPAPGLPPTPIEAPGDDAIAAAANPADGDWYYYVTVDLSTGETKFAETYDEFLAYKDEYTQYCDHLRRLLMAERRTGCGVLGDPIAHSLSPALHRAATPSSDWTGSTTPTGSAPAGWRRSSRASAASGAGCR